jgi:site-specific DNA recombinase
MNETGIYVRVSTEEQAQEGFSIRAQEQKLKDYARIKDWDIYKIYADEGISGKDIGGRPAVKELIADVAAGIIKNVLVFKIDRLTRSTADLIYLVDTFNKYDCAFNSLLESIDTHTASGRMFLKIIGIFAEFERENIIERTKVGVERKVREGYSLCTAQASYGYDRAIGERIQTINESEAEIVREIFEMFVTGGESLTNIARLLNLRGVKTKCGKCWDSTKIRRLLKNSNYIGNVRHHIDDPKRETHYGGLHKPILSEEIFIAANNLLDKNTRTSITKPPNEDKYFSGFLVCAECGYKLKPYATFKQLKTRKQKAIGYVCPNRTLKTCHAPSMSHAKAEAAFIEYISQIADFMPPDIAPDFKAERKKQETAKNIAVYENKLNALDAKEKETLERYVSNELTFDEYRAMQIKIKADKAVLNAEIERIKLPQENESDFSKDDIILNFRENWELLNDSEKRTFLRNFAERIVVENKKGEGSYFGKVRVLEVRFRE